MRGLNYMMVFKNNLNPFILSASKASVSKDGSIQPSAYSPRTDVHHGFTLPEVLLSVAIVGLALTPIYLGQSVAMRQSAIYSRLLTRTFAAKKILRETEFALQDPLQPTKIDKKVESPPTTFSYELKKVPEQSSLKKFKNVWIESISWPDERNPKRQARIVTFIYKPEQKKNE